MGINPGVQRGFILAAVLWVLAIMLIAVAIFHEYVQRKLIVGIQAKQNLQNNVDMLSTEQTMMYLLATSRFTLAGLSFSSLTQDQVRDESNSYIFPVGDELRLDGVQYMGLGNTYFSMQDNTGLLSLNAPNDEPLNQFLKHQGVGDIDLARLMASKRDYIDSDDTESLSGAESLSYVAKNMSPPSNDFLRTPLELVRIMGWQEQMTRLSLAQYDELFNMKRFALMNLNTMPKYHLVKYLGLTEDVADLLYSERYTNPLRSKEDFLLRTNQQVMIDDEIFRYFPSEDLSLRFWPKGGGQAKLISLQLTPNGLLGPWLVDYEYSVESPENNSEALAIRQSNLFNSALGDVIREH
jgi:hypothetical protein